MNENNVTVASSRPATRLLNIGRAWMNDGATPENNRPVMSAQVDRDLPVSITLVANSRIVFFPNTKREGKKDADFRLAVEMPSEVVDGIIARQRAGRTTVASVAPVAA
jgi:hypothetical protein